VRANEADSNDIVVGQSFFPSINKRIQTTFKAVYCSAVAMDTAAATDEV